MIPRAGILFIFLSLIILCGYKEISVPTPYKFPALKFFPKMPETASNPVTNEGVDLGRHLFYDPILSIDSTMSCASCHKQSVAFSDAPNSFSKGKNNILMQRNTMPLFNLAWHEAYFWDGKAKSIEEQVFHPLRAHDEMDMDWEIAAKRLRKSNFYSEKFQTAFETNQPDSTHISKAIAQFLRTLLSYRSKYDSVLAGKAKFNADEYDGFILLSDMTKADCLHCHTTDGDALGTTGKFSNNGLDDVSDPLQFKDIGRGKITGKIADNGKFRIPSLRNVALTAPYMHDGRFKTLEEVIDFYSSGVNNSVNIDSKMGSAHKKGVQLSHDEKKKVIAFLKTLSDFAFVSDTSFSNPFKR